MCCPRPPRPPHSDTFVIVAFKDVVLSASVPVGMEVAASAGGEIRVRLEGARSDPCLWLLESALAILKRDCGPTVWPCAVEQPQWRVTVVDRDFEPIALAPRVPPGSLGAIDTYHYGNLDVFTPTALARVAPCDVRGFKPHSHMLCAVSVPATPASSLPSSPTA